jgi:MscS family membrane protein
MDISSQIVNYLGAYFDHNSVPAVLVEIVTVLFTTIVLTWLIDRLLLRLERRLTTVPTMWDASIVHSLKGPILFSLWALSFVMCLEMLSYFIKLDVFKYFDKIKVLAFMISIWWFLVNIVHSLDKVWKQKIESGVSRLDNTTADAIIKLLKISVTVIISLMALDSVGISISAIIAFGSASGFGISFAARDILANYFGAVMIYLDKPFKVGDWVKLPKQNIEGTIDKIGLRSTEIITADMRPIYVPNSVFSNTPIENFNRIKYRKIMIAVLFKHDDLPQVPGIVMSVENSLKDNSEIDNAQGVSVRMETITKSGVEFVVECFTSKTDLPAYYKVKSRAILDICEIIKEHGVKILPIATTIVEEV